jgi:hypothetical protein
MDIELSENFNRALAQVADRNVRVSAQAIVLLSTLIDSIEDATGRPPSPPDIRGLQSRVIGALPDHLSLISDHYKHPQIINARMVLSFMPRLMRDYCPFENPPNY